MKKLTIKDSMPEWLKKYYGGINTGIDASKEKDEIFWRTHSTTTVETHVVHKDYNVTPTNEAELAAISNALKGKITSVGLNGAGNVIAVVTPTPNAIPKYDGITVYEEKSWIKKILKRFLEAIRNLLDGKRR